MSDLETDLLLGVPDEVQGDASGVLLDDTMTQEVAAVPQVPAAVEPCAEIAENAATHSGRRKIIQHTWPADLQLGIDPSSAEEQAKREARAAKFGLGAEKAAKAMVAPPPEAQLLTAEEVEIRNERAAKWGTAPHNPLDSIVSAAPKGAFWEKRRDAAAEEEARPECVHMFGVDRMGTEDILRLWVAEGVPCPLHAEWVNDSSVNVVFGSADEATAALTTRTVPLLPGHEAVDSANWRTLPLHLAAAGKGLQLLFRRATHHDVKPPERAPSRWYGEVIKKGQQPKGRKADGRLGRRDSRRQAATPYGKRDTLAAKAREANEREAAGDLRSQLPAKPPALKHDLEDDLRVRIASRKEPRASGASFSYADFKRKRSEAAAAEEDDDVMGSGSGPAEDDVHAKAEEVAGGFETARRGIGVAESGPPSGSSAGVSIAPADAAPPAANGMDVEG